MRKTKSLEKKAELIWELRTKLYEVTSNKLPKGYMGTKVIWTDMVKDNRTNTNGNYNYEVGLIFDVEIYNDLVLKFYDGGMKDYTDLISGEKTSLNPKDDIVNLEFALTKLHYLIHEVILFMTEDPSFCRFYHNIESLNELDKKVDKLFCV